MLKLNTESVVSHYKALADAVDLPIVVQDYPPISGFAMEAALLARIAREVPTRAHDQARRSADAVQDGADSGGGRRHEGRDSRRPRRRVPARRAHGGRRRRDDGIRVSGGARQGRLALSRREDRRGRERVLPVRAVDALRVPGRHRHGDSQGSLQTAGRACGCRHPRAGADTRRGHAQGARSVLAWTARQEGASWILD